MDERKLGFFAIDTSFSFFLLVTVGLGLIFFFFFFPSNFALGFPILHMQIGQLISDIAHVVVF